MLNNATKNKLAQMAPTVLSVLGSIAVVGVTVLSAVKTKDAVLKVDEIEKRRGEKLTKKEIVKVVAPIYIPVAALDVAAIACIMGANTLNQRQQATLMSAYALVERTYSQYKGKVKELYGDEVHENVVKNMEVEELKPCYSSVHDPFQHSSVDFGDSDTEEKHLFYDQFSMRYFNATFAQVLQAEYHLNRNFLLHDGENYVNEFYDFLGLDEKPEYSGFGWWVCEEYLWIDFNHIKTTMDDGLEVWIIEMVNDPTPYKVWEQNHDWV